MEKEYLASLHSRRAPLRPGHPRLQLLLLQRREVLLGHVENNVLKNIRCKETMGLGWVSLAIRLFSKVLALARFGLLWLEKGNGKGGQREREKMPKYATKPSKNR